ncbi:MAG: hypothetical protein R3B45_09330 [Bdellovibrionota bacterium]
MRLKTIVKKIIEASFILIIPILIDSNLYTAKASDLNKKSEISISTDQSIKNNESTELRFCEKLSQALANYHTTSQNRQLNFNKANQIATIIIDKLRQGNQSEYLNISLISNNNDQESYLSLTKVLGATLEHKSITILGFNLDELRYLPHVQNHTNIVLVIKNTDSLSNRRAKLVTATALRQSITISTIWIGAEPTAQGELESMNQLKQIINETNGKFINLNVLANQCEIRA